MNLLAMGDEEAQSLGLNPSRVRLLIIAGCTLLTSAAVSISGIVGWVGLIIPHMARMIVGPDNKILLPASLSLGASFLLLIDNISRAVIAIEIPIGILTAIIGIPIFLYLLKIFPFHMVMKKFFQISAFPLMGVMFYVFWDQTVLEKPL